VAGTGNAAKPTGEASTLAYRASLEQQAKLLGTLLGGQVRLVPSDGVNGLVLTVGTSFRL
jgi:hypothetical protein